MGKAILFILSIIVLLTIGWHLGYFILGGVLAITGTIWGLLVASIIVFCTAVLLFFILTGFWIFILGIIAFVWITIAIAMFPVLFPILVPLLIVLICIAYFRRRGKLNAINNNDKNTTKLG